MPSEGPNSSAHGPAALAASEPTVGDQTSGKDAEVVTTSAEISAKEPEVVTNGAESSIDKSRDFITSNGVQDAVSDVETTARSIRDSGIGFVNGEDDSSKF